MKNKHSILLPLFLSIIFLLSVYHPILAERQQQSTVSNSVIFCTYPDYYLKTNSTEPIAILYPRSAIPVILTPEQSFTIQVHSIAFDRLTATITTAYDRLPDSLSLIIESISQENDITYVIATIPTQTPTELYNITLTIQAEGLTYSTTSPRSVSVKKLISDSFTFVHLTDFHIGDLRGLTENFLETINWKAARKVIEEVNLLQPDFVLITGDLVFGQYYPFEYSIEYKKCYEILQEFDVPTYLCPGNHDGYIQTGQDGLRFWEQTFGPLYYSFNYANTHFICINSYDWSPLDRIAFSYLVFNWGGSIRQEQMDWIENDLSTHGETAQIIMGLHHNPLWNTINDSLLKKGYQGRDHLLSLIRNESVDVVLAGHVHYDDVTIDNDTIYITTTTMASRCDSDGYWGYRLITVENNALVAYNYKEPKYSIPSYHLIIHEQNEDSITIENKLEQAVPVILEFIAPKGNYSVNQGTIVEIREQEEIAAIYVSTTLYPRKTTTIMLS